MSTLFDTMGYYSIYIYLTIDVHTAVIIFAFPFTFFLHSVYNLMSKSEAKKEISVFIPSFLYYRLLILKYNVTVMKKKNNFSIMVYMI